MKSEEILMALGDVDERYMEEAAPKKKRTTLKWSALAASLLLVCGITAHLLYTPKFETFLKLYDKGYYRETEHLGMCAYGSYAISLDLRPIDNHLATYESIPQVKQSILKKYVGNFYDEDKESIWYYIKGKDSLEYLISEHKTDGKLELWRFLSFSKGFRNQDGSLSDEFEDLLFEYFGDRDLDFELDTCTFDAFFRIYGLESAEEIEKIIVTDPFKQNTSIKTIEDTASIQIMYNIMTQNVAYGNASESPRFTYNSSENFIYRHFDIVLTDGTVIDTICYDAEVGAFTALNPHTQTFSALLPEDDVSVLNTILDIE